VNIKYILFASLIFLTGCLDSNDDVEQFSCTTAANVPAINLTVVDKDTGSSVGCGTIVIFEDTNFSEKIVNDKPENCHVAQVFSGAHERSGVYDIHVYKEGYLNWSAYSISVTPTACSVNTVDIIAELEK
jgi:hypothetical protein